MMKINRASGVGCFLIAVTLFLTGCAGSFTRRDYPEVDGDRALGRRLIDEYGCSSCHTIPGVAGANATVGPPLTDWADRHYIAGNLQNTPENLISWIRNPQAIEPGTAMPDMGVTTEDAQHIAAFLFSLRRSGGWNLFR